MKFLIKLNNYISELEEKELKKYIIIFIVLIILIILGIIYQFKKSNSKLKAEINFINTERLKVKQILEKFELVKKQREDVDAILERDKDFKIKGYFDDLLKELKIIHNKAKAETSEEELDNGYTEIKLDVNLQNINTKILCNILNEIEKNERVYAKELEVIHKPSSRTMEINLTIATLQPKLISAE